MSKFQIFGLLLVALSLSPITAAQTHASEADRALELLTLSVDCKTDPTEKHGGAIETYPPSPITEYEITSTQFLGDKDLLKLRYTYWNVKHNAKRNETSQRVSESKTTAKFSDLDERRLSIRVGRFVDFRCAPGKDGCIVSEHTNYDCDGLSDCRRGEQKNTQTLSLSRSSIYACSEQSANQIKLTLEILASDARGSTLSVAQSESVWLHNGSEVVMSADGNKRIIRYSKPRAGLVSEGVDTGTILFDGEISNDTLRGEAYRFSKKCGSRKYEVSGHIVDSSEIKLQGRVGKLGQNCSIAGSMTDELLFTFVESQ